MDHKKLIVTGRGKASRRPDTIEITISLTTISKDYSEAIQKSNQKVQTILDGILSLGFHESDLKTTHFSIRTLYKSEVDASSNYYQVFYGYACDHGLLLEMDLDIPLLGEVLAVVSGITSSYSSHFYQMNQNDNYHDQTNVTIQFTLKDKESIQNEAVENAIKVAKEKALILAMAANVTLEEIIEINYSFGPQSVYSPTNYEKMSYGVDAAIGNITPEDITVDDVVTVTWRIK